MLVFGAVELNRSCAPRKRHHKFSPAFRILWVVLSKFLDGWEQLVHLMKPETVKRWHTRAFRAWWRWKSRPGRKPVALETQQLIRRLSKENPLWGAARIRGVLLLMGYEAPGEDTVRKYMVKSRRPRPDTTNWLPFLRNHLDVSWAIDFFTVTTLGFQVLYVFLVFDHARREVVHFAITPNPTMERGRRAAHLSRYATCFRTPPPEPYVTVSCHTALRSGLTRLAVQH